jgi:phosphatidylglycerophosphate synthase
MQKEIVNNHNKFDYRKSLKKPPDAFLISKIKFIDQYLNRPLAALVVRAVFRTAITPNGLTYISFFLGLLAAFFFSRGEYRFIVLGGILAQMSSIIDGADGMLARAKEMCSEFGSYLDLLLDRIIDFSLLVGISVGASLSWNDKNLLLLGLLTAGLYLLQINLFYLTKSFLQVQKRGDTGEARALMMLLMLVFALINRMDLFIYTLMAETIIVNITRLIYFISLGKPKDS